jgi:hypothetical protein
MRITQDRFIPGYTGPVPLKPGTYKVRSDFYEVDRDPRVGEDATDWFNYARQCGRLIKTTYETLRINE